VKVPALRERREDIPLLAAHFARAALGEHASSLAPEMLEALCGELTRHDWPGNVRELRNVVERAVILADPRVVHEASVETAASELQRSIDQAVHKRIPLRAALAEMEREYVTTLLRITGGDLDEAAGIAQVHRKSLERIMRRLEIRRR
jgi:DNA-binding NtrC family response regulator